MTSMTTSGFETRDDALMVSVCERKKRIIFHFRRLVDYDVDGADIYFQRMGETLTCFGAGYGIIFDYSQFEPEPLSERQKALFAATASALKALGYDGYVRVVPRHLRDYFEPYRRIVAEAGLQVRQVNALEDAHALYDARVLKPRPPRAKSLGTLVEPSLFTA